MSCSQTILAGWLVLWMLVSPVLHEQFHSDAASASHQCVVTLVQQQQLLAGDGEVAIVPFVSAEVVQVLPHAVSFGTDSDYRLLPGRAPPVLS